MVSINYLTVTGRFELRPRVDSAPVISALGRFGHMLVVLLESRMACWSLFSGGLLDINAVIRG